MDLLGSHEYRTCQERVFGALESGDEETIAALYDLELRSQPLFIELLKRNLPPGAS